MKIDSNNGRLWACLSTKEYTTSFYLAEKLNLSEKTVRQRISILADFLAAFGASIEAKRGSGYRLVIENPERYASIYAEQRRMNIGGLSSSQERVEYILSYLLLMCHRSIYADPLELCEILFISESTLSGDMRLVKERLKEYNLNLITKRKTGVMIEGNEFDIRICMADYVERSPVMGEKFFQDMYQRKVLIAQIVLETLEQHDMNMPEVSLNQLINHIFISILRITKGYRIIFSQAKNDFDATIDSELTVTVKELCHRLEASQMVQITESEYKHILLYMIGQRTRHKQISAEGNFIIPGERMQLVRGMMSFVYETMNIDLRNDFAAIMDMAVHMESMDIRLKYNLKLKNPLLQEVKSHYPIGYMMALQASYVVNRYYDTKITEDEIGYLGAIYEVALKRNKQEISIKVHNVLLVCPTGRASAELLARQLRMLFDQYLREIRICSLSSLRNMDFKDVDYVFTTTHIPFSVPVPILEIRLFLKEKDAFRLKNMFDKKQEQALLQYYQPNLFFGGVELDSKDAVLSYLCCKVQQVISIPEDFLASVMKREEVGSTDFGDGIAMPHPYGRVTTQSFASVCVLKKPVFWGNQDVSVVILVSIANDGTQDLEEFYQPTAEFMLHPNKSRRFLKDPNYENLIRLMTEE